MINIQLQPQIAHGTVEAAAYRIATRPVLSNIPLVQMSAFKTHGPVSTSRPAQLAPLPNRSASDLTFCGPAWVAGKQRHVECSATDSGYYLKIAGIGSFAVARDGGAITQLDTERGAQIDAVIETVIGPLITLALAIGGIGCLHASAIATDDCAVAIAGESGKGKSTLARFAYDNPAHSFRRLADDVVPVAQGPNSVVVLPHFPQLKLRPCDQVAAGEPERIRLKAVYVLDTEPDDRAGVSVSSLSPQESILTLVRHTHAAKLFSKALLANHLEFCANAAASVVVRRLSYPKDYSLLPEVLEAIKADL